MPGSQTAQGRRAARDCAPLFAFRCLDGVGTEADFAVQWLAYACPCQRYDAPRSAPA
jgi:hypothetical protein